MMIEKIFVVCSRNEKTYTEWTEDYFINLEDATMKMKSLDSKNQDADYHYCIYQIDSLKGGLEKNSFIELYKEYKNDDENFTSTFIVDSLSEGERCQRLK